MNITEINWTDLTWNPLSGCKKISAECEHCYAHTLAENKRGTAAFPNGFDLTFRPHKLTEPQKVKAPSLIFTNSMSDLFLAEVPFDYVDRVFATIAATPRHRYQILTKRPERAAEYFSTRPVPDNVWMGATIGVRKTLRRADALRGIKARVRFLSCEPLLERLDGINLDGIDWVIGGGESGQHLSDPKTCHRRGLVERNLNRAAWPYPWRPREDKLHIARHLRDECIRANVAFWWKQWGGPTPKGGGRLLDGVEWNEMPDQGWRPENISAV